MLQLWVSLCLLALIFKIQSWRHYLWIPNSDLRMYSYYVKIKYSLLVTDRGIQCISSSTSDHSSFINIWMYSVIEIYYNRLATTERNICMTVTGWIQETKLPHTRTHTRIYTHRRIYIYIYIRIYVYIYIYRQTHISTLTTNRFQYVHQKH